MKIEPGYYKTRDGRKARVLHVEEGARLANKHVGFCLHGIDVVPCAWATDGRLTSQSDSDLDLVSPWIDEPAETVTWYRVKAVRNKDGLWQELSSQVWQRTQQAACDGAARLGWTNYITETIKAPQ